MKKLLTILGISTMAITTSATLISCGPSNDEKNPEGGDENNVCEVNTVCLDKVFNETEFEIKVTKSTPEKPAIGELTQIWKAINTHTIENDDQIVIKVDVLTPTINKMWGEDFIENSKAASEVGLNINGEVNELKISLSKKILVNSRMGESYYISGSVTLKLTLSYN